MSTITPTISADQVKELETLLKGRLRTAVASALNKSSDLIGNAEQISTLVAGIAALQQAHDKGYLTDPMDTYSASVEQFSKLGQVTAPVGAVLVVDPYRI